TMVDATLLDHQRPHPGVACEAAGGRDLQTARGGDVAAHEAVDRDPVRPYVGGHVGLGPDDQLTVAVDLAPELPQQVPVALDGEVSLQRVALGEHRKRALLGLPVSGCHRLGQLSLRHQLFLYGLPTAAGAIARPIAPATTTIARTYGSIPRNWSGTCT